MRLLEEIESLGREWMNDLTSLADKSSISPSGFRGSLNKQACPACACGDNYTPFELV